VGWLLPQATDKCLLKYLADQQHLCWLVGRPRPTRVCAKGMRSASGVALPTLSSR